VDVVDVNASPVEAVTAEGIRLRDGTLVELDIIVFATGFGSVTGGGGIWCRCVLWARSYGKTIPEHWAERTRTAMGIALAHFSEYVLLVWAAGADGV